MLPSPPPVTYGEVFGLLTARRDLSFEVREMSSCRRERPLKLIYVELASSLALRLCCGCATVSSSRTACSRVVSARNSKAGLRLADFCSTPQRSALLLRHLARSEPDIF